MTDDPSGPSDNELVAALQRLASARAHLLAAERGAEEETGEPPPGAAAERAVGARNDDIEAAHAELLWAQANYITDRREQRALRRLDEAKERLRVVLRRFGFAAFQEYLDQRTQVATTDVHLDVARREFADAEKAWEDLQIELELASEPDIPTIVIDYTDGAPRRLA